MANALQTSVVLYALLAGIDPYVGVHLRDRVRCGESL